MPYNLFLDLQPLSGFILLLLVVISIWDLVWKGLALWKCGRNNQPAWFIVILLLNTAGIIPIIYLLFFQKSKKILVNKKRKRS